MNRPGPGINPTHDLWEDGQEVWNNGQYFTEAITDKALEYLRQVDRPFLLYVPFNAPHYPMHAPSEYMARFAHLPWDRQAMAAMMSAVDDGVGRIVTEVAALGLAGNTCTFFTSDNGPSRESRNWRDGTRDPYYGGATARDLFREMDNQTAIRRGPWKPVPNGQLVEGVPAEDTVHLSDVRQDASEATNVASRQAPLTADPQRAATRWRAGIEERWTREFSPDRQGTVTHEKPKSPRAT